MEVQQNFKKIVYCLHSSHPSSLILPTYHLPLLCLSIFLCLSFLPLLYVKTFWVNAVQNLLLQANNHEDMFLADYYVSPKAIALCEHNGTKMQFRNGLCVSSRAADGLCLLGEGDPRRQDQTFTTRLTSGHDAEVGLETKTVQLSDHQTLRLSLLRCVFPVVCVERNVTLMCRIYQS